MYYYIEQYYYYKTSKTIYVPDIFFACYCNTLYRGAVELVRNPKQHTTMTDQQENRMNMFLATQLVMQENSAKWNTIPALVQAAADLDASILALKGAMGTQVRDLRGYTKDKRNAEEKMIQLTLQMGGAVMAWAEVTGNQGMAEEMNLMQSTLHSYRDAVVAERCQVVHDVALANMASLADYGLTVADTTALLAAITKYTELLSLPRMLVTVRKSTTSEIGFLVRDTMRLLSRRLDRLMRRYEFSDAPFHRTYTNARIIIDQGSQGSAAVPAVA